MEHNFKSLTNFPFMHEFLHQWLMSLHFSDKVNFQFATKSSLTT